MPHAKPQVTIDLDEYNELKAVDIDIYKKSLSMIFRVAINPPRTVSLIAGPDFAVINHIKELFKKEGISLMINSDLEVTVNKAGL